MAKKKDHTGFRNGDLFCFNCGASYKMPLPQPMTMAAALMFQFAKDHKNCKKSWAEPVNEGSELKTETENAKWWTENGEHGESSKAMFNCLARGLHIRAFPGCTIQHPIDLDDFKRCYKLLKAVPQWASKERLTRLKELSPVWEKLVDNWDKLTEMYEENIKTEWKNYKTIGMYEFMKSLTEPS